MAACTDNRIVHLRYTPDGQATALAFFGPLGARTNALLDVFSSEELAVIEHFITRAAEDMSALAESLESETASQRPKASTARDRDAPTRRDDL